MKTWRGLMLWFAIGWLGVPGAPAGLEAACLQGDCVTGTGVYAWPDGTRYEGGFQDTRFAGRGVYTWPDGRRYEGQFIDGQRHGRGIYIWPSGAVYEGQWQGGRRHGLGTYRWPDGARYEGQWAEDAKNGLGVYRFADGHTESGRWQNDVLVAPMPSLEVTGRLEQWAVTANDVRDPVSPPAPGFRAPDRDFPPADSVPGPPPVVAGTTAALDATPIHLQAEGRIIDGVGTDLTTGQGRSVVGHLTLNLVRRSPETIELSFSLTNTSACRMHFEGWMMIGDLLERIVDWREDQDLAPRASRQAQALVVLPANLEGLALRFQPKGRLTACP
jgi:hypothetical protein